MRSSLLVVLLVSVAHAQEAPEGKRYVSSDASGVDVVECRDDGHGGQACARCETRDGKDACDLPLTAKEVDLLAKQGVVPSNPPAAAATTTTTTTTTTNGTTTTVTVVAAPAPAPARRAPRASEPYHHPERGLAFALEVGAVDTGDGANIYRSGLGRGWMLGYGMFEFRVESYDLGDQTKTYDDVANASGRAGIYSFVARPTLLAAGPLELVATVGVALVTRPSLRDDPDDIDSDIVHLREQWGGALVIGGGVRIYDVLTLDVRAYPAAWSGIAGNRAEDLDGKLVMMPLADSPGGVPISVNAGVGLAF